MKKETRNKHTQICNNLMNYIYNHIDTDINIDELSIDYGISKFHLHRIFKEEFGKNIYETIKSIRLQKASTLLITNKQSTITQIAKMCGYSSQTSFIRTFKERFSMTPKQWKKGGYLDYSTEILHMSKSALLSHASFHELHPTIVKMPAMKGYYIRHNGYNRSIKQTWEKLQVWTLSHEVDDYLQIGLHHDNPILTPLNECQYVASVVLKDEKHNFGSLPSFTIPKGIYAKFHVKGIYGDVLKLIQYVYHTWLVNSGYETTTHPSFAIYKKNHFLSEDEEFDLEYYVPIQLI